MVVDVLLKEKCGMMLLIRFYMQFSQQNDVLAQNFQSEISVHIQGRKKPKTGNVEIIIFTGSAHDLVCPAKYLTYCSQRQTQHAGGTVS